MLKCGNDCYLPQKFQYDIQETLRCLILISDRCSNGQIELRQGTMLSNEPGKANASGSCPLSYLHLTDLPYENYFVSDCSSASQVVVTNPQVDSGLRSVGPRLLVGFSFNLSQAQGLLTLDSRLPGHREIAVLLPIFYLVTGLTQLSVYSLRIFLVQIVPSVRS